MLLLLELMYIVAFPANTSTREKTVNNVKISKTLNVNYLHTTICGDKY